MCVLDVASSREENEYEFVRFRAELSLHLVAFLTIDCFESLIEVLEGPPGRFVSRAI